MANIGGTVATFTTTEEFNISVPCTVAVDPASTGTVTVQIKAGTGWATAGVIAAGEVKKVDSRLVLMRCLVTGAATYEVR